MIKRIFLVLLVLVVAFSACITANAYELPGEKAIPIVIQTENHMSKEKSPLSPCSLDKPTSLHDLRKSDYTVKLDAVGKHRLYTNVTFHPDLNQRLYITVTVKAIQYTTTFKIGYYDITADEDFGAPYTIDMLDTSNKTVTIYAFDMKPSHEYAIYFTSDGAVATGSGTVFHGK